LDKILPDCGGRVYRRMLIRAWAQSVITAGDLQGFVLVEHEKMDNCVLDIRDSRISAPT